MATTTRGLLRSRPVLAALAGTLMAPLGVPLVSPALPAMRAAFELSDATASLLVSAYFAGGVVLAPFVGALGERVGRRTVLAGSLVCFGLAGGAVTLAPTFGAVLAVRVVQGVAAAGVFVTTVTVLATTFEGVDRSAVLGLNAAALSAGAAVYPLVGGALAAISWRTPFYVYLLAVPVGLLAWTGLDADGGPVTVRSNVREALAAVATRRAAPLYAAAFLTEVFLVGVVFTAVPFYLTERFDAGAATVGLVVSGGMTGSFLAATQGGALAARLSNRRLVAAGYGCYAAGMLGVWLASSTLGVAAATAVHGAGVGLSLPAVDDAISDAVAGRVRSGALGLRIAATFLGRTAGPVGFAALAGAVGYPAALLGGGVVAAAAAGGAALA